MKNRAIRQGDIWGPCYGNCVVSNFLEKEGVMQREAVFRERCAANEIR